MRKVNTNTLAEVTWRSPKGRFAGAGREVSEALGRKPDSTDLTERHPFDVEICRIPPGKCPYPYHAHSAQWEFYHVISGAGVVRHKDGSTRIEPGDAFLFKPGEPHQITNDGTDGLLSTLSQTTRSGSRFIIRTAANGACRFQNGGSSAPTLSGTTMARNEELVPIKGRRIDMANRFIA